MIHLLLVVNVTMSIYFAWTHDTVGVVVTLASTILCVEYLEMNKKC